MPSPIYKKVDYSLLRWGITIPWSHVRDFESGKHIRLGTAREVEILFNKKRFTAHIRNIRQTKRQNRNNVYQIRYDGNKELLKELRRTFIHTFVATSTQREKAWRMDKKWTRTALHGAQELLVVQSVGRYKVRFSTFFRVEDQWTPFLERLVDENVFPWLVLGEDRSEMLFQRCEPWHSIAHLKEHSSAENVIYYLADTNEKELYVGKAKRLGERVKQGRREIRGWNQFRYDVLKPEYAQFLPAFEENAILALAFVLQTSSGLRSIELSRYRLVNKAIRKA